MHDEKENSVRSRYDSTAIGMLAGLEPVRARGPTIINGAALSEKELEQACQILAENSGLWQVEVMDKKGRITKIFRDP